MTVVARPRAPETEDGRDLEERIAELEALIEEARRRARRRRTVTATVIMALAAAAAALVDIGGGSGVPLGRSVAEGSRGSTANTSGKGRWGPSHGPEGGDVLALAVDPRDSAIAYAGGWGVVFKTTNGGKSWRNVTTRQRWGRVSALAVDPTRPATVYVATERGVAKTTNGGRSWSSVNTGLFDRETPERREHRLAEGFVRSMTVDSGRPSTAYVTTSRGLFRMKDGGARWRRVLGPQSVRPYSLVAAAIDPGRPGLVYASWVERRAPWNRKPPNFYKSTDSGSTWQRIDTRGEHPWWFGSLTVDPHNAGTLYATDASWERTGLWKSDDDGATWRIVGLATQHVTSFLIDPGNRATIFATTETGVFTSSDRGITWRRLGAGTLRGYASVVAAPRAPDTLYGAGGDGLVKSVDGGRTWLPVNAGFVSTGVAALALAHESSRALIAGTWQGVYTSPDGGGSWRPARSGLEPTRVVSLAVEQRRGGAVYAGTRGFGVFKSADGGLSWRPVNAGLPAEIVAALTVDPERPDTVYAGAAGRGVYKTVDGGATWKATTLRGDVQALALDQRDAGTIFAGTTRGLFRSTDGGDSWERVATAAGTGVSLDRGAGDPGAFQAIAIDPVNPETVYAGIRTGGIVKSLDGGDTWVPANAGRTNPHVDALAVDPRDPRILYVAGDGGVFRSTDGARSWHRFDRGLGGLGVRALAVAADGRTVFAGTGGRGVVDFELAG